jgi:pyruvate,water dikinase
MAGLYLRGVRSVLLGCVLAAALACGSEDPGAGAKTPEPTPEPRDWPCEIGDDAEAPDFLQRLGCRADFDTMASEPLDASIPGARSVKVVLDQLGGDALYFQNSTRFKIHYEFASAHLSGTDGLPFVSSLSEFNETQYFTPDRRFLLGAATYYDGAGVWALEIAPYDNATAEMIQKLYEAVEQAAYFGPVLVFHPTSESVAAEATKLPQSIEVRTNDQLFAAIDYQPLNLGSATGQLRFLRAAELGSVYLGFRDIVVLDEVPNDISVVSGLITEQFQTPLSHVNVLAQNRKTPNMSLRGATSNAELRALEGEWVRLSVGAFEWSVVPVTKEEADADWEMRRPMPVTLPPFDLTATDLRDIEDIVVEGDGVSLRDAIKEGILAFGGKSAHYSILAKTDGVPARKAFGVPIYYYVQFMEQNGFYERLDEMLADPEFQDDAAVREARLQEFRDAMEAAPVDEEFQTLLREKIENDYPGLTMRFRTSTNSEDLDGFPCAGCYESHTGDPAQWETVLEALRETWASIWLYRTFEERSYAGIDHRAVGMGLLVHHNFPTEEANGVALTANPFDPSGLQPGFYVNVQRGGAAEVVHPPPGVTSDEIIYQFHQPGQPVTFLSHSNLVREGETVLTPEQLFELGTALDAIHRRFSPAYGPAGGNTGWYAMDVEFKFDGDPGETPRLFVKQARPHPGRGQ